MNILAIVFNWFVQVYIGFFFCGFLGLFTSLGGDKGKFFDECRLNVNLAFPIDLEQVSVIPIDYGTDGYDLVKTCKMPTRYFTQGLETIDDHHFIMSSGMFGTSKMAVLYFDFETCKIEEKDSKLMNKKYFAEGAT